MLELKKAIFLLQQGLEYRPNNINVFENVINNKAVRAYRFKSSFWYRIYGLFICIIQFILCFIEPNSLLITSNDKKIMLSLNICLIIELYCIMMHFIALYIAYVAVGKIRKQLLKQWLYCLISLISIIFTFIYPLSICRIYRFLRPLHPFIYWQTARMWKDLVFNAFQSVIKILIFAPLFIVFICSILVYSFYNEYTLSHSSNLNDLSGELPEFNTLSSTMLHMFFFSAALNTPSLWSKIYKNHPIHALLWILLSLIMYQLFQNILLSTICNYYSELEQDQIMLKVEKIRGNIDDAYHVIANINPTRDFVTKRQMKYVYNKFNDEQYSMLYDKKGFEIYWLYANNQREDRQIFEKEEFNKFCLIWFATFHLEYKQNINSILKHLFLKKTVLKKLSIADLIFTIFAVFQVTLILWRLYHKSNSFWIIKFINLSNIPWIIELVFRIYVLGLKKYIISRHIFNGIITIIILFTQIIYFISQNTTTLHMLTFDSDLHILRLGFAIIVLSDLDTYFHQVLYSTIYALNQIMTLLFCIILFQIVLALIGCELFANILQHVSVNYKDEISGISDDDKVFTFDSFWNSFNLISIIFAENMVNNYLLYYKEQIAFLNDDYPKLKSIGSSTVILFFIFAYVIQVMFLANLLTSIFLNGYEWFSQNWIHSLKLKQLEQDIANQLQTAADKIAPNKYEISYWFPSLHSTQKIRDLDQFLQIR